MEKNREIEIECIALTAYEDLCKLVGTEPKIEITSGRDYSESDELASWYEDRIYPNFTKSKQKKLLNFISNTEEGSGLFAYIIKLLVEKGSLNKEEVKKVLEKF